MMENNFIQMAASAGHAVAYTNGPIFKHIIDCVQLYVTNGFTNIVIESVCLFLGLYRVRTKVGDIVEIDVTLCWCN